jgi:predicted hotdog family 3-hydroxylacyl-ACP dehydratase
MLWLEALTECADNTAQATARFSEGHFAVANGAVLETALVECVAQTAAAALGHRAQAAGKPAAAANGMLAAVSRFRIQSPPPLDTVLTIAVTELKRFGPMLLIAGTISCEGRVIASGEMSLYA